MDAVHFGQDLSLLDVVPHLDVDLADSAAALGHDVVHGVGLDGRGVNAFLGHHTGLRYRHFHVGDNLCGSLGGCGRIGLLSSKIAAGHRGCKGCKYCNSSSIHMSFLL